MSALPNITSSSFLQKLSLKLHIWLLSNRTAVRLLTSLFQSLLEITDNDQFLRAAIHHRPIFGRLPSEHDMYEEREKVGGCCLKRVSTTAGAHLQLELAKEAK